MASVTSKGKEKVIDLTVPEEEQRPSNSSDQSDSSSSSDSDSESDSDSSSDKSEDEKPTSDHLKFLLEKALENARRVENPETDEREDEILTLSDETQAPLPKLNPGLLPEPYIQFGQNRFEGPSKIRDPAVEQLERAANSVLLPAPPIPPPALTSNGKPLTKKQKKQVKEMTAGPAWFDMAAPSEADLPRMYREVEALRLRNQLDPKRFYKKDEGEGKGMKGLPKYFAIGTILPSSTPFGTASSDNLTRAERKRTLVDELVDDAEAKRYAKKKFEELQGVRGAKGKNTLRMKQAMRQRKW
ncbi:Fcf2 pre-rRNA processing-domain-containing protein [Panaeolus papilionaceus]|nr:Fcf2 pre-rRNA processing-domain-containing protein [Panaeolus papilionaceus]